ncbi:hypothetical protein LHYA1_G003702 [Lachnellula hyalina]|uniref:Myb-like domain-containing protein n=1 Tax=Lachnellula hyalina TaxID=1316788 RepID=A0A8H8R4I8_9HELO|nr:uncharacterized protein LHYA1_G003702 [Lachnellula hyalina]TVY28293.1 hypothetical protein LHYA1_G003702 [Lachnellula hyalina]
MPSMTEAVYSIQPSRTLHNPPDLTPYSAVSSFNLPVHYDASLITPISMSDSTPKTRPSPTMRDKRIKLSPTSESPTFHLFSDDEDFGHSKFNPPMKHKDSLQVFSPENSFPLSPLVCPEPFWGSYGVSAPLSAVTSNSSPAMLASPNHNSASSISNDSHHSRQPTPSHNNHTYGAHNSAPILIAPNPVTLRGAVKQENGPYRQNSLQSDVSTPRSQGPTQVTFIDSMSSLGSSGSGERKRKSPEAGFEDEFLSSDDLTYEEHLLLQLTEQDQLPWKEVAVRFNEKTDKQMKVPALQMRKKRLIERLRERALIMAWEQYERSKWDAIAQGMLKHGCTEKWTREAVQKKWNEMHHDEISYLSGYERKRRHQRVYSEETNSVAHSSYENDTRPMAVSTVTMDQVRSRTASDTSYQMQFHRQQQAHMVFEEHRLQQRQDGSTSQT